jgi:K+-sensing histidine kinase KdpD
VRRILSHRKTVTHAGAVLLPLAIAAVMVPFRASLATAASALVLAAVVVAVAAVGTRMDGWLASVSAGLWFDFFLTRPYERFAITHRPDIETAICLFVVGVVVTELAARSRHHFEVAVEESDYVGLIYGLSELVTSGARPEEVIDRANVDLVELLHLRACRFERGEPDRRTVRIAHEGEVLLAGSAWAVSELGLPGPELELHVQSQGRVLGRYVMKPTLGHAVSLERRLVAVAVANQVGAALTPRLRTA